MEDRMESTIKETKELLKFALELGNALGQSLEDKKLTFSDATYFLTAIKDAPAAFAGINKIPGELKEFTPEEQAELKEFVMTTFDIPQDKVEGFIEKGIEVAFKIYEVVSMFIKKKLS